MDQHIIADPYSCAKQVDDIIEEFLPQQGPGTSGIPGLGVLVMDGDDPVLLKGYGHARTGETGIKITPDTVFDLGSLSKQFTAMAILMLIDGTTQRVQYLPGQDKITLQTKLSRFFSGLPGANQINLQSLLNHSSGLPDYLATAMGDNVGEEVKANAYYARKMEDIGDWYATMIAGPDYLSNKAAITLVAGQKESIFKPRTDFDYCNTGYVVLAEIVRQLTGVSLGEFLQKEIFDRLGMNNTFVYDDTSTGFNTHALCYRQKVEQGAVTYVSIEGDTIFNCIHGDGNVHSTLNDLIKWLKEWNRIDKGSKYALISKQTFFDVYDPHLYKTYNPRHYQAYDPELRGGRNRGYRQFRLGRHRFKYSSGFHVYRFKNRRVSSYALFHGGDWLGFHSYLMRGEVMLRREEPRRLSIVVLANYAVPADDISMAPYTLAKRLSEVYWKEWGLQPWYNVLEYV